MHFFSSLFVYVYIYTICIFVSIYLNTVCHLEEMDLSLGLYLHLDIYQMLFPKQLTNEEYLKQFRIQEAKIPAECDFSATPLCF